MPANLHLVLTDPATGLNEDTIARLSHIKTHGTPAHPRPLTGSCGMVQKRNKSELLRHFLLGYWRLWVSNT